MAQELDILDVLIKYKRYFCLSEIDKVIGATAGATSRVLREAKYRHFTVEQEVKLKKHFHKLGEILTNV